MKRYEEMKDYKKKGLFCEYEYCIEEQPLTGGKLRCPVWGHNCPGGTEKLKTCNKRITDVPKERMYKGKINERGEAIETGLELAMTTKEAIKFINWAKDSFYISVANKESTLDFFEKGDKVISLLERGEKLKVENTELKKYKKIVGVLENIHCVGEDFEDGETSYKRRRLVKNLKQKYFPKEYKK